MKKIKIGIVGIGDISGIYLKNISELFKEIEVIGVCDLIRERSEKAAQSYNIQKIYDTMYDLFADSEVDIVLNLTRPYEHFEVSKAALLAGKHVYSEKPLSTTIDEGRELVYIAEENGLLLGGAPDTFMGAGIQTCRKLIEDGCIGTPIGAAAFMICHGHESWHHDPEFYYKHGGGPMMDMGPYYITALVNLLGKVNTVTGMSKITFPQRTITSKERHGSIIDVEVPTYITGLMQFDNNAIATIFTTFDVYYTGQARFEIYGSKGTLIVPDPNCFDGEIKLLSHDSSSYNDMPLVFPYKNNSRALGLADMAKALQTGRKHRANSELTYHVLEIMNGFIESSLKGKFIQVLSNFERTPQMPLCDNEGILD